MTRARRGVAVVAAAAVLALGGAATAGAAPAAASRRPVCQTSQLRASFGTETGFTGHYSAVVVLRSTAAGPCTLFGYVGLQLLDATGHPLATTVTTERAEGRPRVVTLRRSGRASTVLTWVEIPAGTTPCVQAAQVQLTPPANQAALTLTWPPEHNVVCSPAIDATPIQAGLPRL